jgi:hypothetical protein
MISLVYYLRVLAAVWMEPAPGEPAMRVARAAPAMAGGSPEAEIGLGLPAGGRQLEVVGIAVATAAASIGFGIVPSPLLHLAGDAGRVFLGLA